MTAKREKLLQLVPWITAFAFLGLRQISHITNAQFAMHAQNVYYTESIFMIIVFNIYMLKKARCKRIMDRQIARSKLIKREYRLMIQLLIVNVIFFGSCVPLVIIFHIYPSKESRQTASYVRNVVWCYFAVLLNAAANPLVYGRKLPVFQWWIQKRKQQRRFPFTAKNETCV